jgi:predicted DNA binding CopG/RHH family protein
MAKQKLAASAPPKFANEQQEAGWWASPQGREFMKEQSVRGSTKAQGGSKLVTKLTRANSVQIALRLPSPDLAKAREIAERKGIGYQTLLKMIVHEGLQRAGRQS